MASVPKDATAMVGHAVAVAEGRSIPSVMVRQTRSLIHSPIGMPITMPTKTSAGAGEDADAASLTAGEPQRREHGEGDAVAAQHGDERVDECREREDRDECSDEPRHGPEPSQVEDVDLRDGFADRAGEVFADRLDRGRAVVMRIEFDHDRLRDGARSVDLGEDSGPDEDAVSGSRLGRDGIVDHDDPDDV